jgi:hypothetical protein
MFLKNKKILGNKHNNARAPCLEKALYFPALRRT